MLALQAAGSDPLELLAETAKVLRAVLPRRWHHRLTGDPVALLLALPEALRQAVLGALLAIPKESNKPLSELERIRQAQRGQVYGGGAGSGPRPTLALATLTCRVAFGDRWWWAPDRWPTSDGHPPFAVCWIEWIGLQALEARERLVVADGTALASSKDANRVRRQLLAMAYPGEDN